MLNLKTLIVMASGRGTGAGRAFRLSSGANFGVTRNRPDGYSDEYRATRAGNGVYRQYQYRNGGVPRGMYGANRNR